MKLTRLSYPSIAALLLVAAVSVAPALADNEKPTELKRITKTKAPIQGVEVVDLFEAIKNKQIEVQVS